MNHVISLSLLRPFCTSNISWTAFGLTCLSWVFVVASTGTCSFAIHSIDFSGFGGIEYDCGLFCSRINGAKVRANIFRAGQCRSLLLRHFGTLRRGRSGYHPIAKVFSRTLDFFIPLFVMMIPRRFRIRTLVISPAVWSRRGCLPRWPA